MKKTILVMGGAGFLGSHFCDRMLAEGFGVIAMDNLITAANVARNKLDGNMVSIMPAEVERKRQAKEDFVFLDVRTPEEHEQIRLPGARLIPLGALRERMVELPKDGEIIVFCNISLRGYEASLILRAAGFQKVSVMEGGVEMWPYGRLR